MRGNVIHRFLNSRVIVSEGVALRPEFGRSDVHRQGRQRKLIGIFGEIAVIFNRETVGDFYVALFARNNCKKERGKARHVALAERNGRRERFSVRTNARDGGKSVSRFRVVLGINLVNFYAFARVAVVERSADGDNRFVRDARFNRSGVIVEFLFSFEGNRVDINFAVLRSDGYEFEFRDITV